jgi:hypothetical protein
MLPLEEVLNYPNLINDSNILVDYKCAMIMFPSPYLFLDGVGIIQQLHVDLCIGQPCAFAERGSDKCPLDDSILLRVCQ